MPHYAIVVQDSAVAHAKEIERNVAANVKVHGIQHLPKIVREVTARAGSPRAAGTLHAHLSHECPDGLPNCRNCGDPKYAANCQAAGHCPHCGTRHGIAPDRVLEAHGYALVEVTPPTDEHEWHPGSRKFVKRK